MLNLIVVNSDIKYVQKNLGNISKSDLDVKIYNFFIENNKELYNLLETKEIDIIVIGANEDGNEILEYIFKFVKK